MSTDGNSTSGGQPLLLQRAGELAAIAAASARARAGAGSLVLVDGAAGIGKTALLRTASAPLQAPAWRVLTARGYDLEGDYSYGVVRQLFDPLRLGDPGEWHSALDGAAALAHRAFEATEAATFGDDVPYATMHGLFWLAANLAAQRPLALFVDDGHWADRASARWLLHLARRLEGMPIMIVVAARNGPGQNAPEELAALHDAAGTMLRPLPLQDAAVARLVRSRHGDQASEQLCQACRDCTGGNPFLLESLLAALRSAPTSPHEDAAATVRRLGPEPVARAVLRRVGLLGDGALGVARALAVLGKPSSLRQVSALAGVNLAAAARLADDLRSSEVLSSDVQLEFIHPIVRAAIYDAIPASERGLAHAAAAELLAQEGADPEQLAPHLMRVEPAGRASVAACLSAAADVAIGRGTPDVAVALLRRAADEPPDQADRPGTAFKLALALASLRAPGAPAALREAVALQAGLPGHIRAAVQSAGILGLTAFHDEAAVICRDVLGAIDASSTPTDPAELAVLQAELAANALVSAAGLAETQQLLAAGKPAARSPLHCEIVSAFAATLYGQPAPANVAALTSALTAANEQPPADSIIAMYIPLLLVWNGELLLARQVCTAVMESARSRGSRSMVASMTSMSVIVAARLGLLEEAVLDGKPAFHIGLTQAATPLAVAWAAASCMEGLIELGRLDEADEIAAAALSTALRADYIHTLYFQQSLGRLRLAQGRAADALDVLRAAGAGLTRMGMVHLGTTWRADAALAYWALGRHDEAAALAAENLRLARGADEPYSLAIALRTYVTCAAAAAALAEELLTEAIRAAERTESALGLAYALRDFGAYLRRAGRRGEAREPLRRALELAHRCGAVPLADRARSELIAVGARPRRASLTGAGSLTTTERRVADLANSGLSNRQIAQHLFVTLPTVETHLRHVFQKLGITSRGQLAGQLGQPAANGQHQAASPPPVTRPDPKVGSQG